jgi:hypothetical protein
MTRKGQLRPKQRDDRKKRKAVATASAAKVLHCSRLRCHTIDLAKLIWIKPVAKPWLNCLGGQQI